jgi:chemotaxis protein methyltransferase WspC
MEHAPIYLLLQNKIGLDIHSIGAETVSRAIKKRMQVTGSANAQSYFGSLRLSRVELAELIEQVVIPETWFFRNRESFRFLSRYVQSDASNTAWRVLSVPCASGEEPYSIAMALMEGGLSLHQFRIDAMDISATALEKAKHGLYRQHSFRGGDLSYRDEHFQKLENGWRISDDIRKSVRFMQHNFLEAHSELIGSQYDIIFCRNLLIYLNVPARQRVLKQLYALLKKEGLLFAGHSEAGLPLVPFFQGIRPLAAFVHQKCKL